MKTSGSGPKPPRFDSRQKAIYKGLRLLGDSPATFYLDACDAMGGGLSLRSITHIVGHLLREIDASIRDLLRPFTDLEQPETTVDLESVIKSLSDIEPGKDGKCDKDDIVLKLKALRVVKSGEEHKGEIAKMLKAIGVGEDSGMVRAWTKIVKRASHRWAHRDSLSGPRPVDDDFLDYWEDVNSFLSAFLDAFGKNYLIWKVKVDELRSIEHPTIDDAKRFRREIINSDIILMRFFDGCVNPEWVPYLKEEGFFDKPPHLDYDIETGLSRYSHWPLLRYLAKMTRLGYDSDDVFDILMNRVPNTDNYHIYENLLDIAIALPPDKAAIWLKERALPWLKQQADLPGFLPNKLRTILVRFAEGGQSDMAFALVHLLLEPAPDSSSPGSTAARRSYSSSRDDESRIGEAHYRKVFEECLPALVDLNGLEFLATICQLLDTWLQEKHPGGAPYDSSYIWRPSIADNKQNHPYGLHYILTTAARDVIERLLQADKGHLTRIISLLKAHNWKLFQRLSLHALTLHPEPPAMSVEELVIGQPFLDDDTIRHEYVQFLRRHFVSIEPNSRAKLLAWIDEGPDRKTREDLLEAKFVVYKEGWQLKRYAWIGDALPSGFQEKQRLLEAKHGKPEHSDFAHHTRGVWVGPTSPTKTEELMPLSVPKIVEHLESWVPLGDRMSPSREGLGRQLQPVVTERAAEFCDSADKLKGLNPVYIGHILKGFVNAFNKGIVFSWERVFGLCRWVNEQHKLELEELKGGERDKGKWSWVCQDIARLVSTGIHSDSKLAISIELRTNVWEVLAPIVDDPNPTKEYETEYGRDPEGLAINSTRGEAMQALVHYAWWIYHKLKLADDAECAERGSFIRMPEVEASFDKHLDVASDPSTAIRTVYGRALPLLAVMDPIWVKRRLHLMLPGNQELSGHRDAVWRTYLLANEPNRYVFNKIRLEYLKAVDRLGKTSEQGAEKSDHESRLAEHLMVFYWWGELKHGDSDMILKKFWENASGATRAAAIEFIGRCLDDTDTTVAPEASKRLVSLWEERVAAAEASSDPNDYQQEMAAFGWWYISGRFDGAWSISNLQKALRISAKVSMDDSVLDRLADMARARPADVIGCLDSMSRGGRRDAHIFIWQERIRTILSVILDGDSEEAKIQARELINFLGSLGYIDEFSDLLE